MRPSFTKAFAAAALALAALAAQPAAADRPLVIAFVPQENPEKLLGDFRAIGAYLETATGRRIQARVTPTTRRRSRAWRREAPTSPSWARSLM